ncbi:MAG: hypothetical protein H6734_18015 [Alphaproteobacteria bacterium]|nr:hypothetical protein [Alphaproteobacteria bacterium]
MTRFATALAALALVGCGGSDSGQPQGDGGENAKRWPTQDTLVIASQADIGSLIPVKPRTATDSFIMANLAIETIDSDFDCSLKKREGLAKSWEWSDDGKKITIKLHEGVTWEDGEPVTADDIKFSYELAANPNVASPRLGYLEYLKPDANPRVIDDHTLEFEFTRAYDRDAQAAHVSLEAMPRHILGSADPGTLEGHPFATNPTFFGPWRLAKHIPNQSVILEPNWKYTGPEYRKPKLDRVVFKVIPEYSARIIALEKGDVDLVENLTIADVDRLRKEHPDDLDIKLRGYRAMDYVGWNGTKFAPFNDIKVRQALAHAVDRDRIMKKILTGEDGTLYAKPAVGTITPELCGVHNDDIVPLAYDPEKAKGLLAEAGWTDSDGDGWLDKDGQKFAFTMVTNQGNKRRGDTAVEIQADLKKIGIDMSLDTKESNTFFERVEHREYEAFLAGWSASLFIDPSTIWGTETLPDRPRPYNHTLYSNAEVDALISQGLNTPDPREAAPIWKDLQAKIYADQPYLFLWWLNIPVAIHKRFEGEKINVLSPYQDLHEWYVPADKVKYKR